MGKFGISSLKKADDLLALFYKTTTSVQELRNSIKFYPPCPELLYKIDEISNLCTIVADTSQAICDLFPSEDWKNVAYETQDKMHELFSQLNHDLFIYNSLVNLKNSPAWLLMTHSQRFFALSMLKDLEKEGILKNSSTSLEILRLQSQFLYNVHVAKAEIVVDIKEMESVPIQFRPQRPGAIYANETKVALSKSQIKASLNSCANPSLRSKLFEASNTVCSENLEVLTLLLEKRQKFACETGFPNFSDFALSHQSFPIKPSELITRLTKCHELVKPKLLNEYSVLLDLKALKEQKSRFSPVSLDSGDIPYYINTFLDSQILEKFPGYTSHHSANNYFTIFNVLEGLQQILGVLFSIECHIEICAGAETWSNDIIKVTMNTNGSALGVLYLDLFSRPSKSTMPAAKYNIMCAKKQSLSSSDFQRPVVVLSCNFPKSENLDSSLYLTFEDLKHNGISLHMLCEFYHELGHALHSLLSQGDFQSYSGTRVPLDLAEIPSHVFEHFITDYEFVKTWARHSIDKKPIPVEFFQHLHAQNSQFAGFSHHIQLSVAIFDLVMHSEASFPNALQKFEANMNVKELQKLWFCSVEHFVEYASCYYSYILDKALSHVIWDTVFQKEAMNANAGKIFQMTMLSQGGNVEAQVQIDNLLRPFLILDQHNSQSTIDPFYVMEYWYKNYFSNSQLAPIGTIKSDVKIVKSYTNKF